MTKENHWVLSSTLLIYDLDYYFFIKSRRHDYMFEAQLLSTIITFKAKQILCCAIITRNLNCKMIISFYLHIVTCTIHKSTSTPVFKFIEKLNYFKHSLQVQYHNLKLVYDWILNLCYYCRENLIEDVIATLVTAHSSLLIIDPDTIPLNASTKEVKVEVKALEPGYITITLNITPSVAE